MPDCAKRLFVGIYPASACLDALVAAERTWRSLSAKSVPVEKRHLTLCFLGSVPESEVPRIIAALGPVASAQAPLPLTLAGLGVFPNLRRPQVLWAGLEGDVLSLSDLASGVQSACVRWIETPENKPFHPHLTIARLRAPAPSLKTIVPREAQTKWGSFVASEFHLIESRQDEPGGPYVSLAVFPFRKPAGS